VQVGGVFVVLGMGMIVAAVIAFIEFLHQAHKHARADGVGPVEIVCAATHTQRSMWSEMCSELHFAISCRHGTKPVRHKNRAVHRLESKIAQKQLMDEEYLEEEEEEDKLAGTSVWRKDEVYFVTFSCF
jgi:apolipoprotein N-acyltransferase